MTNNEIVKSIRYTLDIKNRDVAQMIKDGGIELSILEVANLLKDDEEEGFSECPIETIHAFLDGLILKRRGPSDGPAPKYPKDRINNTMVLRKLRIAFEMKDTDMIEVMKSVGFSVSKGEINALFRSPTHKHYKKCGDQFLRNFLKGLTHKLRPSAPRTTPPSNKATSDKPTESPRPSTKKPSDNNPWSNLKPGRTS